MKFDRSNKFDLCYYGQVNTFGRVSFILLVMLRNQSMLVFLSS